MPVGTDRFVTTSSIAPECNTRTTFPNPGVGKPAPSDSSSTYSRPSGPKSTATTVVKPALELTMRWPLAGANPGGKSSKSSDLEMVRMRAHCGSMGNKLRFPTNKDPSRATIEVGTMWPSEAEISMTCLMSPLGHRDHLAVIRLYRQQPSIDCNHAIERAIWLEIIRAFVLGRVSFQPSANIRDEVPTTILKVNLRNAAGAFRIAM